MSVWDKQVLCGFMFLLAGAESQRVNYPDPVCAVKGSSVTLPCSFTHQKTVTDKKDGREVTVQVTRVVWCQNHEICQNFTPSVYASRLISPSTNNPRYSYLGDKKGDCTLQITDVQKEDEAPLRFRMEGNAGFLFTGQPGVKVTVADGAQMKIRSSRDGEFKRGEAVTLTCTTTCTIHKLEVTWSRDGHALTFTGPSLHLGSLTGKDSGNYTCGLKSNVGKLSPPHRLFVEDEGGGPVSLIVGVVFGVLLALCTLVLVLCIIRRKRAADKSQSAVREEAGLKEGGAQRQEASGAEADVSYAPIQFKAKSQTSNNQKGGAQRQEARGAEADVNYAPIRFKAKSQTRPVEEAEDAIIYSSVVGRA